MVTALFVLPSNGAAVQASLNVSPDRTLYGGQRTVWSGNIGSTGEQRVWIQRRGDTSSPWADVIDPRDGNLAAWTTNRDGSFSFEFPSPAMNYVYMRVVARSGATPAHLFKVEHQDVIVSTVELDPADVPLPPGLAVVGEPYAFTGNSVQGGKPVLAGRAMTLQQRNSAADWDRVAGGTINQNGQVRFSPLEDAAPGVASYRVRMENYVEGAFRVGWFVSFPFEVRTVRRPQAVSGLLLSATASQVTLKWTLPSDAERQKIVVARSAGRDAPPPSPRQIIATLSSTATTYVDRAVNGGTTYKYAVWTVSAEGVYNRLASRDAIVTPSERSAG